jgi:hypothetical protein
MTDQSVSMVYKLIANGTYPSVRIGQSVRVPLDKLRIVLSGESVPAGADPCPPVSQQPKAMPRSTKKQRPRRRRAA